MNPLTDQDIEIAYSNAYVAEYERYTQMYLDLSEPARDKRYATALVLYILGISYGFRQSSLLDKAIENYHLHSHNLGKSKAQIIRDIPRIIEEHKKEEAEFRRTHKNRLRLSWKYSKGILPGWVLFPPKNNKYGIGSVFEMQTNPLSLAKELGDFLALNDFVVYLKSIIHGTGITAGAIIGKDFPEQYKELLELYGCLEVNNLGRFFAIFKRHFASIPYHIKSNEALFHVHIVFVLQFLGSKITAENNTNNGRIDCTIETSRFIYIIEFKEKSVDKALLQIQNKKYYQKFEPTNKTIILVGVAFDNIKRNITDWKSIIYTQTK